MLLWHGMLYRESQLKYLLIFRLGVSSERQIKKTLDADAFERDRRCT